MPATSRKPRVVYTIPFYSQDCEGRYARFHDVIHTLQRMRDPPWQYTIVPLTRYLGQPAPNVLFRHGSVLHRTRSYLRNIWQASHEADVVHVVEGQLPFSLPAVVVTKRGVPIVAGPNVALGINRSLRLRYWGPFSSVRQELAFRAGLSIYAQNKMVYHRHSPLSLRFKRVFMFRGYADLALQIGGLSKEKLVRMPTGVRTDIFKPIGEAVTYGPGLRILYVGDAGRAHIKGLDVFLAALSHLKRRDVPFFAYLVGKPTAAAERLVRDGDLTKEVRITGFVARSAMAPYYRGADVYVCSSRYEADCTTAAEALACGTPVIGTNVPGIDKSLSFRMGDAEDLARKLVQMYENLNAYRAHAQSQSGEWSIEAVIDEWHAVYHQVASGG